MNELISSRGEICQSSSSVDGMTALGPHSNDSTRNDTSEPGLIPSSVVDFEEIEGVRFVCVNDSNELPPFLINVISSGDHWMFVGSNGAITAGRRSPDEALFPYGNQDQLFDSVGATGGFTIIRLAGHPGRPPTLWEPWAASHDPFPVNRRRVFKDLTGSCVVFQETNPDLGLCWRHSWSSSDQFGIVRRAELVNQGDEPIELSLLDGIRNILPHGLDQRFQTSFSVLGDAYKMSELILPEGIGIFSLSSLPTDRAEPNESLLATVAWTVGIEVKNRLLSTTQVEGFRRGQALHTETSVRGRRGAFLVESEIILAPGESAFWWTVADIGITAEALSGLVDWFRKTPDACAEVDAAVRSTRARLQQLIASVDGVQSTVDEARCWRHFSNALFNVMRGGVFENIYGIPRDDFLRKLEHANSEVFRRQAPGIRGLPALIDRSALLSLAGTAGDPDFVRLVGEYLPLSFSRRHGDPSRPWNRFAIEIRTADGSSRYAYQGNWRDIFQNWEALVYSFPGFTEATIFRFLNASTADGYNPYRLTDGGFEWEVIEADQTWSNIGYWGDHQIIYLLRLLEASKRFHPDSLSGLLDLAVFAYASVPYRIRDYEQILLDPRNTVDYDSEEAARIGKRVGSIGADGRLLWQPDGSVVRVGLLEKLLVPLLAKLSNFVAGGGIWMNTQRPEWNDANNALVGFGVSVVTLGYVHRYLQFLVRLLESCPGEPEYALSVEVADWLDDQARSLVDGGVEDGISDGAERRALLDRLGRGATAYRSHLYRNGFSGDKRSVGRGVLLGFLRRATQMVAASLWSNRRDDGLFHAYNLIDPAGEGGAGLQRLVAMLEGQVSILSSGLLDPEEAMNVLDALRCSRLFRSDQGSYLLYPDRELPRFLEKNRIPEALLGKSKLLTGMIESGETQIMAMDRDGVGRFNASFHNVSDLRQAMERLTGTKWEKDALGERSMVECIYEETFHHRSFTGRSMNFFAYEGLGSVYWHMVSKLILAIQENHGLAIRSNSPVAGRLAQAYHETLEGIGIHKSPSEFGAFPTDAYSHTPANAGAQQPGMTGQVKEDLLIRLGELGVTVSEGTVAFDPRLLRKAEFHSEAVTFDTIAAGGTPVSIELPPPSLGFTFCQVPVIYRIGAGKVLELHHADGRITVRDSARLNRDESGSVFNRAGNIRKIVVRLDERALSG